MGVTMEMGIRMSVRMSPPLIKTYVYYFYGVIKFHSPMGQVNSFCRQKNLCINKYVKRNRDTFLLTAAGR